MVNFPRKVNKKYTFYRWHLIIVFYLLPPLVNYIDLYDGYFHNALWFFYLIPTLVISYHKGTKYGILATGVSSLLFLGIEPLQLGRISQHEWIIFFELTAINLLISIFVGFLVKRYHHKRRELARSNNLLESVFNHLTIGIWSMGKNNSLLVSKGVGEIYGMSVEKELRDYRFWKRSIHPDDAAIAEEIDKRWENLEAYEYEYRIIRPDGEIRWIRDSGVPIFNENGEHERYDGTNLDISKQKELEEVLKESEKRYKNLVENNLVGVFMIQNRQLVYVNQWLAETLGASQEKIQGTRLLDYVIDADRERIYERFINLLEEKETFFIDQIQTIGQAGPAKYLEIQARITENNGISAIIGIALDVTEKRKAREALEYLAYHDLLTGLPNKHYLEKEFYQSSVNGHPFYILSVNLDRFKLVNDSFGHGTGDDLLKMVSTRLLDMVSPFGTIVRTEGDEFLIYLADSNKIYVNDFAQTILTEISIPFDLSELEFRLTASIGIAAYQQGVSLVDVVQQAGSALHVAKEMGGNQYQLYSSEMGQQANRRLLLEQRLQIALEENHFEVVYQPKLNLATNRISGMEALIRWQDPILGVVSPAEFIPIAEETGKIISIGKWVLKTACRQTKAWEASGHPPLLVCVNISSRQFLQDDFVKMIEQVLMETELSPKNLNLEITERIALYSIDDTVRKLKQLKQLGVSISLDDFGTGYSSLSYLKLLPIDYLKIDSSFINGMMENKQDLAIIESIISLSHSLGISVVAEGVEDKQQLNALIGLNCDETQGYYYAKPLPVPAFNQFLMKVNGEAGDEAEMVF